MWKILIACLLSALIAAPAIAWIHGAASVGGCNGTIDLLSGCTQPALGGL